MQYLFTHHHITPDVVWAMPPGARLVLAGLAENEIEMRGDC